MNFGIVLPNWIVGPDTEHLIDFAIVAEESGWDGVFLADHLAFPHEDYEGPDNMDFHDPWITMAGIATQTTNVTMASWITPIPRRQPWQVARNLATVDRLSGGRVILGTGLGHPATNYTPFGRTADPTILADRYDEALTVIDGLWSGDPYTHDGEHFTIDNVVMLPTPQQEPRIPIVAGGVWPKQGPIRRGARWDGIVPHWAGDGVVPADGDVEPAAIVEELLYYYHEHSDGRDLIMLPLDPPGKSTDYEHICRERGATWLYSRELRGREYVGNPDAALSYIREGPPS